MRLVLLGTPYRSVLGNHSSNRVTPDSGLCHSNQLPLPVKLLVNCQHPCRCRPQHRPWTRTDLIWSFQESIPLDSRSAPCDITDDIISQWTHSRPSALLPTLCSSSVSGSRWPLIDPKFTATSMDRPLNMPT